MKLADLDIDYSAKLGSGSYDNFYVATHTPTKKKVAVKELPKKDIAKAKMVEALERDFQIHKKLEHINIVRLYAHLEDQDKHYLVMEYFGKSSSLFERIHKKEYLPREDKTFWYFM